MPTAALPALHRRPRTYLIALGATLLLLAVYAITTSLTANAASTLLSQGKPATASSTENAGTPASAAVDGNTTGTRWSSAFSDPQWIQVDLGATASITQVVLTWEAAYATAFQIQVSDNASTWTSIYSTTTGTGGTQTLTITGSGRYVRMYGTARATGYGYSLWEFQVYGTIGGTSPGGCGTDNAAQGRTATASSTENSGTPASNAVDGSTTTRWSSAFSDPQWLQVDLGSSQPVCQVLINWETAYAKSFQIQLSDNGTTWNTVYTTTTGAGGNQTYAVSGSGRYVRVYGTVRATGYGYSIWELGVHLGTGAPTSTPPSSPSTSPTSPSCSGGSTVTGGGALGSNVIVYDPSMSGAQIQSSVDSVFATQESNQFGTQRYALLFKPGTYSGFNAQIGFYTSIAGLGQNPDQVQINGDVTVDAGWFNGNATQNFWRSAENFSITPSAGFMRWAVAQAAPFRRIDVHGDLNLAPNGYGWASGGYIADSRVSGTVGPYSQQQWFTRNSQIGGWTNGVWNMVFVGVNGAPAQSFPNPVYTTVAQAPVEREKPYLYTDSGGAYRVFVPSMSTNTSGVTWAGGNTPGSSIPLTQFYVAHPGDSAATLNQALCQGLNLLFTPGVYHVNQTLNVSRADTIVMGLGMATIIPDGGVNAMNIADVDGVKVAGLLFDAGTTNSQALLTVGTSAATSHASDPISIQDVFFRIGGAGPGSATNSLVVNASNTIIDHIWAWRADHGAGVGWTSNPADTGLIVNGNNVTAYGLFVEHYQKYEVLWNGNGGREYFFQNEMPYDVPSAAGWQNNGHTGYAAFKVADSVTSFEAWGVGSYCNFTTDSTIAAYHAFETPNNSGVKWHDLLTVSLGGKGSITHVINDTGAAAQGTSTTPVNLVSYP
jgi:F5/8 type C domain